jgi:hypothetical protein
VAESPGASESEKAAAKAHAKRLAASEKAHQEAVDKIVKHLGDNAFLTGLGSYGGEEFLCFQIISESLLARKSKEQEKWEAFVGKSLNQSQNRDGSWAGGHCLTGRNFCTASAVLTLLAHRVAPPPAAK